MPFNVTGSEGIPLTGAKTVVNVRAIVTNPDDNVLDDVKDLQGQTYVTAAGRNYISLQGFKYGTQLNAKYGTIVNLRGIYDRITPLNTENLEYFIAAGVAGRDTTIWQSSIIQNSEGIDTEITNIAPNPLEEYTSSFHKTHYSSDNSRSTSSVSIVQDSNYLSCFKLRHEDYIIADTEWKKPTFGGSIIPHTLIFWFKSTTRSNNEANFIQRVSFWGSRLKSSNGSVNQNEYTAFRKKFAPNSEFFKKFDFLIGNSNGSGGTGGFSNYFDPNYDIKTDKWHMIAYSIEGPSTSNNVNWYVCGVSGSNNEGYVVSGSDSVGTSFDFNTPKEIGIGANYTFRVLTGDVTEAYYASGQNYTENYGAAISSSAFLGYSTALSKDEIIDIFHYFSGSHNLGQ